MLYQERQQKILDILRQKQSVTVGALCSLLYISEATVRRDLSLMEKNGMIVRVRGGAAAIKGMGQDKPLLLRSNVNREKKEQIAKLAIRLLKSGKSCFFDSSSTASFLAKLAVKREDLTVITNGITTLNLLNEHSDFTVISTGGRLRDHSSFVGNAALATIDSYCADLFFFSACGVSQDGQITEALEDNTQIKQRMLGRAKTKVLLCDSTKFGEVFLCRSFSLSDIDVVVTDKKPEDGLLGRFSGTVKFIWE